MMMRNLIGMAAFFAVATLFAGCSHDDDQLSAAPVTFAYNQDADVWANTASFTLRSAGNVLTPTVEYRKQGATEWQSAPVTRMPDGSYKAVIAPQWVAAGEHASGAAQFTLDNTKGVFAGYTYEYRMLSAGAVVAGTEGKFSTVEGSRIPGGDMEAWSLYNGYSAEETADGVYYPNANKEHAFWSNGNNAITQTLCQPDTISTTNHAAKLKGYAIAFLNMFAAGNLYSGNFEMSGLAGYACFGQKYEFSGRPSALKLRYKATITKLEVLGLKKDSGLTLEDTDRARVLLCITDWSAQHRVYSGYGVKLEQVNAFDPETDIRTAEGRIIAYGSKWIETSAPEWTELTIPVVYTDKTAKPQPGNYSLVISSSASAYGDFLCGSGANELYLDDLEWVY